MYYPIFLDISQAKCLIVGAGKVGFRKAQGLLQAQVKELLVIDNKGFEPYWDELKSNAALKPKICDFEPSFLQDCTLVFACTTNKKLNTSIANHSTKLGIPCNCVDNPLAGSFIVPAVAKPKDCPESNLMAALSTEGASPAWARVLRMELEDWLKPHTPMTILLGRLRPLVLALGQNSEHNKQIFRAMVNSPLRVHLANGQKTICEELLQTLLPAELHSHITELIHDII